MEKANGNLLGKGGCNNPAKVYSEIIQTMTRLAQHGLVHCDCNEFNIIVDENDNITLIDFPQMISTSHPNAPSLFDRDVNELVSFFSNKLGFTPLNVYVR